jgi:hypothetical protein
VTDRVLVGSLKEIRVSGDVRSWSPNQSFQFLSKVLTSVVLTVGMPICEEDEGQVSFLGRVDGGTYDNVVEDENKMDADSVSQWSDK